MQQNPKVSGVETWGYINYIQIMIKIDLISPEERILETFPYYR